MPMAADDKSATPDVMYDWRVEALKNWMKAKEESGVKITMDAMTEAGHLDQYHYLGLEANQEIIKILQAKEGLKFLDVGSGIGGPARYISYKSGCEVFGIDIQKGLVDQGNVVCDVVGLADKVKFDAKDCTADDCVFEKESFDGFYSILVFLHIPKEPRVAGFKKIADAMKDSSSFVIEDYALRGEEPLTAEEQELLTSTVGAVYIPSQAEYKKQLEEVGFTDIEFEDMSEVWTKWTCARRDRFLANAEKQVSMHGQKHFDKMKIFYNAPPTVFSGGRLGGVRITGRKANNTSLAAGRAAIKDGPHPNNMTMEQVCAIMDAQKTV